MALSYIFFKIHLCGGSDDSYITFAKNIHNYYTLLVIIFFFSSLLVIFLLINWLSYNIIASNNYYNIIYGLTPKYHSAFTL